MEEEDTIGLIDLLRVVWRWKWMIILLTTVCMVAAVTISIMMPRVYRISIAIEPSVIGVDESGKYMYLNSSQNIAEKINEGVYNQRIEEKLKIDPLREKLEFKVGTQKDADFIKVTSEWEEDKIDLGLKVLEQLYSLLAKDYENAIEDKRSDYDKQILLEQTKIQGIETQRKDIDKQIALKLNDIQEKKNQIKLQQANLSITTQRRKELIQEIKEVKDNTEKIVQQRDAVLQQKGNADDISLLLYSTTIQQNVAYFNQLNNQINRLMTEEENIGAEIEKLNKEIDDIKTEIERLKLQKTEGLQTKIDDTKARIDRLILQKDLIENIKLIQPPEVSPRPIRPKKKLNVILAGFVGSFISIFLAFFIEYLQRMKSYPQAFGAPSQTSSGKDQEY